MCFGSRSPRHGKMESYKPGGVSVALFGKKNVEVGNTVLDQLFSSPKQPSVSQHPNNKRAAETPREVSSKKLSKNKKAKSSSKLKKLTNRLQNEENEVPSSPVETNRKNGKNSSLKKILKATKKSKHKDQKDAKEVSETAVAEGNRSRIGQGNQSFPFVHESMLKLNDSMKSPKKAVKRKLDSDGKKPTGKGDDEIKRPRKDRKRDRTKDNCTLFVGNCPLSADKKILTKMFRDFGAIESIRFRCAPSAQLDLPRRAIVITKNFHEKSSSYIAYIVFKDEEAAKKALSMNGHLLDGLHLRVDLALEGRKHDRKKSLFMGNLPFDVKEEDLRAHFDKCGDINNVRVIRDRHTSLGKGIAYVQFQDLGAVGLALKMDKSDFQGRPLRVRVCTNNPGKAEARVSKRGVSSSKPKTHSNAKSPAVEKKKIAFAPSNAPPSKFHSLMQAKRDKRLRKIKKMKENARKFKDGLSSGLKGPTAGEKKKKEKGNKKKEKGNKKKKEKGNKKKEKGKKKAPGFKMSGKKNFKPAKGKGDMKKRKKAH